MAQRTWLITGVSSGFGRHLAEQLLARGDVVVGTVRDAAKISDLRERYPQAFHAEVLDVTDRAAVRAVVERAFAKLGRIDVVVSNAGYGLFGAAEELSDKQIDDIVATNLVGSIQLIRAVLPHMRGQGGGRIIQMSTYGGQVAFPGNSMYHATKWGIEGFAESVAQEVAPFGIGVTIVEPGGARTEFRYGSAGRILICVLNSPSVAPASIVASPHHVPFPATCAEISHFPASLGVRARARHAAHSGVSSGNVFVRYSIA